MNYEFIALLITILGGVWFIRQEIRTEIKYIQEQNMRMHDKFDISLNKIDQNHREDMIRMDEKWERLFERLFLKEQKV